MTAGAAMPDHASHSLVAAGTLFGFAEAQLHTAVVTAFQNLLGGKPGIAAAIEESGRFPSWEAVAGDDMHAANRLLHILQCRRLGEALTGETDIGCRAVLTFIGWQLLADDRQWRAPLPSAQPPPVHADSLAILTNWAGAILNPESPAADDDSHRDIRELAACAFRSLGLPSSMLAAMAEQRLGRDGAPTTPALMDALSGDTSVRASIYQRYQSVVGAARATGRGLDVALVGALNPPLCLTLLRGEDGIPDWDCLQPGRRFQRLCHTMAEVAPLAERASVEESESFIDALYTRCGWPKHSTQIARAQTARDELASTPALAAVGRWLADHWTRDERSEPRVPPATYACCRYVSFLDAFIASRGGLLLERIAADRPLFRCEPDVAVNERSAPPAKLAALVHHAAFLVISDLMDGGLLMDSVSRVLDILRVAGWDSAPVPLAVMLRLPSLLATFEGRGE